MNFGTLPQCVHRFIVSLSYVVHDIVSMFYNTYGARLSPGTYSICSRTTFFVLNEWNSTHFPLDNTSMTS